MIREHRCFFEPPLTTRVNRHAIEPSSGPGTAGADVLQLRFPDHLLVNPGRSDNPQLRERLRTLPVLFRSDCGGGRRAHRGRTRDVGPPTYGVPGQVEAAVVEHPLERPSVTNFQVAG